ncbi:MAG: TonB-dependent receptor [Proteobacteria bacterium]|nr:TonB-dependent receptor [Pseudomonadota bacterium]
MRSTLTTLIASLLAAAAAQAEPATTAGASARDDAGDLAEVTVTARRRSEALKDVPIAVTALSGARLEEEQINAVKDIAALTPGLNINSDSVGRVFMSIRGVGTTLIDSVQPGVGIFFDGIYAPDTSYLNSPIVDVERIEVLRGPQGTLFGNNTLGGAINVVTRQPSEQFEGHAALAYAGPDDYRTAALSLSGPIVPGTLQGRIALSYHDQEGFQKNTLAGGYTNPLDQRSAHGTLRWEPADFATITANGYWDRVAGGNVPYNYLNDTHDWNLNGNTNLNSIATYEYRGGNVKGVFDAKSIATTVTAIASYDRRSGHALGDGDYGPFDFLRTTGANELKTVSGEVRFDTTYSDHLSSLIGVFSNHYTNDVTGTTTLVPLALTVPSSASTDQRSQAAYGTLFWKIRADLELAAGLRFDHQTLDVVNSGLSSPEYTANEFEPRLTLSKHYSADVMTYASVARGFRGGGANGPGAPNLLYKGDSVWTYEVGTKTAWLGQRLVVNADVFYNDYHNFIGQNTLAPSTTGVGFVAVNLNTGNVKSYGAELEAHFNATRQLRFDAGLTLLHARITDDNDYFAVTGVHAQTDRILFTPDWNYNLGASYYIPVAGRDRVMLDLGIVGKGDRVGSDLANPNVPVMPSYTLVNAAVTYRWPSLDVAVFANNLLDAKYQESYIDGSLLSAAGLPPPLVHNLGIQGERRRYGIRLSYRF